MPTGAGKTVLFSHIIDRAVKNGFKCLVLAHREELIKQAADKIEIITDKPVGIIKAGYPTNYERDIQVASVQSLTRRLKHCPLFDLIVVDECHHATSTSYRSILDRFPDARILGVSATPIRLDGSGFRDLFDLLTSGVSVKELIGMGSLSQYRYYAPERSMSLVGVKNRGGDFKSESIEAVNSSESVSGDCLKAYGDYLNGKQAVVFAVSVAHSLAIAASFCACGIPAAHLDGTSDSDTRARTMTAFREGSIKVLTNCVLFDEGLDIPGLDGVILARPTASLGRHLQMVGRALRPSPDKQYASIIDLAGNWHRHGLPDDDRKWSLGGVEVVKRDRSKRLQRKPDGRIEEVTIDLTPSNIRLAEVTSLDRHTRNTRDRIDPSWRSELDRLISVQQSKSLKPAWIGFQLLELQPPLEVWQLAAEKLGYKAGWAWHQWRSTQELSSIDLHWQT